MLQPTDSTASETSHLNLETSLFHLPRWIFQPLGYQIRDLARTGSTRSRFENRSRTGLEWLGDHLITSHLLTKMLCRKGVARISRYVFIKLPLILNWRSAQTYQWGFSFVQLNLMIILLLIWSVGTCLMWLQSQLTMEARGRKEVAGVHKAVLELAESMALQLRKSEEEEDGTIVTLSESRLHGRIERHLNGGSISYDTPLLLTMAYPHDKLGALKAILKEEVGWILVCLLYVGLTLVSAMLLDLFKFGLFSGFSAAFGLAAVMGTTGKSRAILLSWHILLFCVLPMVIYYPIRNSKSRPYYWD